MSGDMRVKLVLDMVNRLSPGAKAAAKDIKSIQQAAAGLKTEKGADSVAEGLKKIAPAGRQAARELKETRRAAAELKREKGAEAVAEGLKRVSPAGRQAARDVRNVRTEARALATERGPQQLAGGLDKAARSAQRLRREMDATKRAQREFVQKHPLGGQPRPGGAGGPGGVGTGKALGLGAAAAAAGRTALMPLAAAYGGYRGVTGGISGTIGQSISFEKAMAEVRKKVEGMDDPAEFAKLERSISKWAITYGRTREEVAALVAEAGAGGITLPDMPEFARVNLAASTAWDVSASQAGNALAKIRAATQWTIPQIEEFVDKVNALADAGSAKEMDVVDMFQRSGAAAKAAGVDFDTALAFLTAMNNVAIAPEVAARGFTAFASKLRTATNQPKKVAQGLKMLGLTAEGVEAGMKTNATETMISVLQKLDNHADKATAAINIFGQEWWDEVARAGQALPEINKALDIVRDPKKHVGSAQKNLDIQLKTTDNHLTRLKALASDVGDRLGRWALPSINEQISRLIREMDALERRAADKKAASEQKAAEEATAGKLATDQPLTAEERARMAQDRVYRQRIERRASEKRTDAVHLGLNDRLRLTELEAERDKLSGSIDARRSAGAGDGELAFSMRRLGEIHDAIRAIDPSRAPAKAATDPRRPADQDERAAPDRSEVMALRERLRQLDQKIAVLQELAATAKNPVDRAGFTADAAPAIARRRQAEAMIRRRLAPTIAATANFRATGSQAQGKGWGDSRPAGWAPGSPVPATGPGRLSFGIDGASRVSKGQWGDPAASWADKIRSDLDIDLGPAGMTMMDRLTAGLEAGAAGAQAAAGGVKTGIEAALQGADMTAAGQQAMSTYAAGLRAGGDDAVAAAQGVAARVQGALANGGSGGRRGLQGALHDGVD